jgi:hypothetical protein
LKTDYKFATAIEQFPQHLIDRWYEMLIMDLHSIVNAYRNLSDPAWEANNVDPSKINFPYNFADACTSYGGCAFVLLCSVKDAEPFFSNYVRHRFDPLAKTPVKEIDNAA